MAFAMAVRPQANCRVAIFLLHPIILHQIKATTFDLLQFIFAKGHTTKQQQFKTGNEMEKNMYL
jgi:hypothetical protein